ncbi:L-threonylcarbamoyladenylate synthase [Holospora curviuscula]|uniref:Threonylcarbamoyl-AMP synthase n=1 Tax=Holospora curviuscula TaxID=1082868 RepID=A0A2S5R8P1_9PROT|nr:L-threonylcarbamoyladenylate synthase [Holospora curviuscula]PPE03694.1 Threonylcarbamoyl-AMP synthase [Holospora curviuscula]
MYRFLTLSEAVFWLKEDEIVGLPTETVYGLAGRAESVIAVEKIYTAKKRSLSNPLIVHYSSVELALKNGIFCEQGKELVTQIWPGPLTVIVPKSSNSKVVSQAHCGLPSIALRVPHHPVMHTLLVQVGPLAAPSANPSGNLSPTTAEHVHLGFSGKIPVLDAGPCTIGVESTIIDLRQVPFSIVRPGYWTLERLEARFPKITFQEASSLDITTPGSLLKHYAPKKSLFLNITPPFEATMGIIGFGPGYQNIPKRQFVQLSETQNMEEVARNIFSALHYLDHRSPCASIGVVPIPEYGIGKAVNDRLAKAALKIHV